MAINNYIGTVDTNSKVGSAIGAISKQLQDQRAQKMALAMALINSGAYQPTAPQPGQKPPGIMSRIGQGLMGPNIGGQNMNIMGQNFNMQTPDVKMANLKAQLAAIQGMNGGQSPTGTASPMMNDVTSGLPKSLPNYSVTPGDIDMSSGTVNPKVSMTTPMEQASYQDKMLDINKKQQAENEAKASEDLGKLPPDQAKSQMMKTNPSYAKYLESLAEGRQQLGGRSSTAMQKIQKDLATIYPGIDQSKIQARYKTRQDFTTGVAAKNIKSLNTAVNHLNEMNKIIPKLGNISFPLLGKTINRIKNFGEEESGNPDITRFKAIKTALAGELSTIYKNSGGTDQEIKSVSDAIDMADSPDQLKASLDEGMTLMSGRLSALQDQWHNAYDRPDDKDFPVISPKSKSILKSMGYDNTNNTNEGNQQQAGQETSQTNQKDFSSLWK